MNELNNSPYFHVVVQNWLDILIACILIFYAFKGYKRGLSGEILQVIGTFASLIVAYQFFEFAAAKILDSMSISPVFAAVFAYVFIFLAVYIVFYLIRIIIHKIMTVSFVGGVEKVGGIAAGMVRGVCILSIVFFLVAMMRMPILTENIIRNSVFGKYILFVTPNIYDTAFTVWEKFKTFDLEKFKMQVNADAKIYDAVQ